MGFLGGLISAAGTLLVMYVLVNPDALERLMDRLNKWKKE